MWKKRAVDISVGCCDDNRNQKSEKYFQNEICAVVGVGDERNLKLSQIDEAGHIEEGPHILAKDKNGFTTSASAVELDLVGLDDSMDQAQDEFDHLKLRLNNSSLENGVCPATKLHPLWPEIDRITLEQLHYGRLGVGEGGWELFAKDGEMKLYKREEEVDGRIMDPLKAVHTVKGVTAHEMCHYFFTPDVRAEWETTLEKMTILEKVSEDTMIFLQVHKRVWPTTQRDALFWSHIRQVPDSTTTTTPSNDDYPEDAQPIWIVCNHSAKHSKDAQLNNKSNGKYIRISLTVSLVCETTIEPKPKPNGPITRDNLTCHINYSSVVNPGGWAPASGLRAVYKREYPRFLKKFTQYVLDKCKDQPILF